MKKLMSLVLALAMILSLAACGGKTTGTSPDSAGDSQQETPATSDGAFPEKQITIIMPWSLGGGPDTIARQVASYGEKYLGVPVIVENHTGGSGTIAMNDALQAEDDGYTMVVANGPLFKLLDIPAEPVPYDGGQEAINALVGGHVDVAIGSPPTYRDYVINGELNCLGTFIPEGLDVEGIGHISSFRDQGVDVDFTGMDYFAVRSSVDDSKKEVLTNFIAEVYADPEFQEFMKGMGMEAWEATESEIVDMVEAQTEAMTEYIPLVQ